MNSVNCVKYVMAWLCGLVLSVVNDVDVFLLFAKVAEVCGGPYTIPHNALSTETCTVLPPVYRLHVFGPAFCATTHHHN